MAEIVPAILERNFNEIKNKLALLRGRVKCVQIDFCDGAFVHNQTWPFSFGSFNDADFVKIINEEEGMPYWQDFDFEFDLMVENAIENFDLFFKLGPKRMIFHPKGKKRLEEFEHFLEGIDLYTRDNLEIGIAIDPNEELSTISDFVEPDATRLFNKVDFVQCMGIDNVGFQNQSFNPKVLTNIRFLKENVKGIVVTLDGGVNADNIEEILKTGVDRVCIGSGIWKNGDPIGALKDFQDLV